MPMFHRGDVQLNYTVAGSVDGPPVLLIAPGGMASSLSRWAQAPFDPSEHLAHCRLVAMDQRNAGASVAPVRITDGWDAYTEDQLALMDHLGIDRFHVVGMCIGGPYALGLIRAAPDRIRSAVLLQPIGLADNRAAFFALFDQWAAALAPDHPEATAEVWDAFRHAMFGGDFVFNATRDELASIRTPVLVLQGDDLYHPASVSRQIADRIPGAALVEDWKADPVATGATVRAFLARH